MKDLKKFIATTIREYLNENVEDKSNILTEKQFNKIYIAQHIDVKGKRNNTLEQNRKSIIENGFQLGFGINALPIFDGVVRNVIDKQYGNKIGDMVYIIKKEGIVNTRNGYKIKEGYKPTENEVFKIEYDYQPTYEAYINNL
jgi:hypothetical protein